MVLCYFKDIGKSPLVLDNLSFRILDLETREDLEADIFINKTGIFKLTQENKLLKTADKHPLYEKLLKKIAKEN